MEIEVIMAQTSIKRMVMIPGTNMNTPRSSWLKSMIGSGMIRTGTVVAAFILPTW